MTFSPACYRSGRNGDQVTDRVMSLEDARRYIAEHPETEPVIPERTAGEPPSIWSLLRRKTSGECADQSSTSVAWMSVSSIVTVMQVWCG